MIPKPMCGAYPDPLHCKSMGIVGRWLFNERGSRIVDVCRNFDAGAISGASWTGSKMGGGLRFDGTDDYVNIGNKHQRYIDYNRTFSISIWYSLSTLSSLYPTFIGSNYTRGGANYDTFHLRLYDTTLQGYEIYLEHAPTTGSIDGFTFKSTPSTGLAINKLYNITLTYNGNISYTGVNCYHDGGMLSKTGVSDLGTITQSIYQSGRLLDQPFYVGARYNGNTGTYDLPFPGTIDQVIIANRVWTPDEVKRMYKNPWSGLICSTYEMEELEAA